MIDCSPCTYDILHVQDLLCTIICSGVQALVGACMAPRWMLRAPFAILRQLVHPMSTCATFCDPVPSCRLIVCSGSDDSSAGVIINMLRQLAHGSVPWPMILVCLLLSWNSTVKLDRCVDFGEFFAGSQTLSCACRQLGHCGHSHDIVANPAFDFLSPAGYLCGA